MKSTGLYRKKMIALTTLLPLNIASFAEQMNPGMSTNIDKSTEWYLQPWPWVAAAAFLGFAVISALRGIKR
jgi:hypothetical protein